MINMVIIISDSDDIRVDGCVLLMVQTKTL